MPSFKSLFFIGALSIFGFGTAHAGQCEIFVTGGEAASVSSGLSGMIFAATFGIHVELLAQSDEELTRDSFINTARDINECIRLAGGLFAEPMINVRTMGPPEYGDMLISIRTPNKFKIRYTEENKDPITQKITREEIL